MERSQESHQQSQHLFTETKKASGRSLEGFFEPDASLRHPVYINGSTVLIIKAALEQCIITLCNWAIIEMPLTGTASDFLPHGTTLLHILYLEVKNPRIFFSNVFVYFESLKNHSCLDLKIVQV